MAEEWEDISYDTDRALDQNGFLNHQYDIFVHDYREKSEIPKCTEHEGGSGGCGESHEPLPETPTKKTLINITRKLQKALGFLNSVKRKELIQDLIDKLQEVNTELQDLIRRETSEFSTTTVKLPDYDPVDMALLLGDDEVPKTSSILETVMENRIKGRERMFQVVGEAEILLNEYEDIKRAEDINR